MSSHSAAPSGDPSWSSAAIAVSPSPSPSSNSPTESAVVSSAAPASGDASPAPATSTQPAPPPATAPTPSSNVSSAGLGSAISSTSIGNYAASSRPSSMSSPSPSSSASSLWTQPAVLAGIVVGCVALVAGGCVVAFLLVRRSRRRQRDTKGMVRIDSRDDEKGSGHTSTVRSPPGIGWANPWDPSTPLSTQSSGPFGDPVVPRYTPTRAFSRRLPEDILPSPQVSIPATLPSYTSRATPASRRGTAIHRDSSVWEDGSEIDVLATDGSSTIRTISTYTEATPTMTDGSSPINTLVGTGSPASANPFDHPGYTYPVGSSNAVRSARPQLFIDTTGTSLPRHPAAAQFNEVPPTHLHARSRAETLRDEYMRSQLALNPFEDSAAVDAAADPHRSPAWSHGNRLARHGPGMESPGIASAVTHDDREAGDETGRGRTRMVAPPIYSKLFPTSDR